MDIVLADERFHNADRFRDQIHELCARRSWELHKIVEVAVSLVPSNYLSLGVSKSTLL